MKRIERRAVIFSIVCTVISFIIAFAIICPQIQIVTLVSSGNPVSVTKPVNAKKITPGEVFDDGRIIIGESGYTVLEFTTNGKSAQTLETKFLNIDDADVKFVIEQTSDGSFTDLTPIHTDLVGNEKTYCLQLDKNNCKAVRIWFYSNCQVENVALYSAEPLQETEKLNLEPWRYLLVAIITLTVLLALLIIDKYSDLSGRLINYIKKNYLKITTTVLSLGTAVILGIIVEILYRVVLGSDSKGDMFNVASCAGFSALFALVAIFITQRKNLGTHPEKAVALIILIMGITIIISQPFAHTCWDNDSHYPWAVQNSFFGKAYYTEADVMIDSIADEFLYDEERDCFDTIEQFNEIGENYIKEKPVEFSAPHLPSGIFIAVARLFGANYYTRYLFGEIATLVCYTVVCYFAIKKLKSGKMIMSLVALFPTNVFIASNYSYDWWVTSFALLGTAYYISELQQLEKPISIRDTIIMCGAFMLMAMPKQLFVIMFALPLFMYKKSATKKEKINYYGILTIFFIITLIMFAMRTSSSLGGSGDTRGGAVDPGEQLKGILGNPIGYAILLIEFLFKYLSIGNMPQYITAFAYMGSANEIIAIIFIVLICFAVLTDKNKFDKFNGSVWTKIVAVLVFIVGASLAATAMYLSFTPVGHDTINGCQARYIMPVLAPVLLTVASPGIAIKNQKIYNTLILLTTSFALYAAIGEVIIKTIV